MPVQYVCFDLDGTLTDPVVGITNSIQYAFERLDIPSPPPPQLAQYIGPPLRATFATLLGAASPTAPIVHQALEFYRERFASVGLFENTVYAGVPNMLAALRAASLHLYVTTSKPRVFAERILHHFALDTYFAGVYGSELDGRHDDKGELLQFLLQTEGVSPRTAVMVGDRLHDVRAAHYNALVAIGVTYGYGTEHELRHAGAAYVCDTPQAVTACLRTLMLPPATVASGGSTG